MCTYVKIDGVYITGTLPAGKRNNYLDDSSYVALKLIVHHWLGHGFDYAESATHVFRV